MLKSYHNFRLSANSCSFETGVCSFKCACDWCVQWLIYVAKIILPFVYGAYRQFHKEQETHAHSDERRLWYGYGQVHKAKADRIVVCAINLSRNVLHAKKLLQKFQTNNLFIWDHPLFVLFFFLYFGLQWFSQIFLCVYLKICVLCKFNFRLYR